VIVLVLFMVPFTLALFSGHNFAESMLVAFFGGVILNIIWWTVWLAVHI